MNFAQDLVYNDETLEAVQRLVPVAEGAGLSLPTLALAWVLRRGEVASAITGASRPEQVHANVFKTVENPVAPYQVSTTIFPATLPSSIAVWALTI